MGEAVKKKNTLALTALTEAEVELLGIPSDELWYLKVGIQIDGPYSQEVLAQHVQEVPNFDRILASRSPEEDADWMQLKNISCFKEETIQPGIPKEQVVELKELSIDKIDTDQTPTGAIDSYNKTIFILKGAQNSGPHDLKDIQEMLANKELLYTDLISYDRGVTWGKILDHDDFNDVQIAGNNGKLPNLPQVVIFQNYLLRYDADEQHNEDSVTNLAFAGRRDRSSEDPNKFLIRQAVESSAPINPKMWIGAAVALLLVVVFSAMMGDSPEQSPAKQIATQTKSAPSKVNKNIAKSKRSTTKRAIRKGRKINRKIASTRPKRKVRRPRRVVKRRAPVHRRKAQSNNSNNFIDEDIEMNEHERAPANDEESSFDDDELDDPEIERMRLKAEADLDLDELD